VISPPVGRLRGRLVVSCQALPGSPLRHPAIIAALAQCAERGGAGGVRIDGPDDIAAVRQTIALPIIGIFKVSASAPVYITPTFAEADAVARAGADIVAVQATQERDQHAMPLADLIARIHRDCKIPVMADVSTVEEGIAAVRAGADLVATTMAGYTPQSRRIPGPDLELIRDLARVVQVPVIAEGRIHTPQDARAAREAGAWAVVVGRAITMPEAITERFARAVGEGGHSKI
jgi:N-acylglucosamine-6-phosphate 2-epimerase